MWDFQAPSRLPPWGDEISEDITSLADYFWTSDGKNLFDVMTTALRTASVKRLPLIIR